MVELNVTLRGFEAPPSAVASALARAPDRLIRAGERINDVSSATYSRNALVYIFLLTPRDTFRDFLGRSVESIGGWDAISAARDSFSINYVEIDIIIEGESSAVGGSYFMPKEFILGLAKAEGSVAFSVAQPDDGQSI